MHEVLVNRLRGLSLPRKSVVRLNDRPDMTLEFTVDVKQQYNNNSSFQDSLKDVNLEFWDQFGSTKKNFIAELHNTNLHISFGRVKPLSE